MNGIEQIQYLRNDCLREIEKINQGKDKLEMFNDITHELKTPLSIILGSLQLLDSYKNSDKIIDSGNLLGKHFMTIRQNCYKMLKLINNLSEVNKLESDFYSMHIRNYDLVDIVKNITSSVYETVINKGLNLEFHSDFKELYISCDSDKIERIMLNLLSNAIKFTGVPGSIYVSINDLGKNVGISVRDTGIGIPAEEQENIFERFKQVGPLANNYFMGSGIGLYLVKSFVELHRGSIRLKSKLGVGSDFTIELPVLVNKEHEFHKFNDYDYLGEKMRIELSNLY